MDILKKPLLTEKTAKLTEKLEGYVFIVDKNANKIQIKSAVEKIYGVNVKAVNVMRYGGKPKTRGTKRSFVRGKTPSFKKAILSLEKGQSIDFYETV